MKQSWFGRAALTAVGLAVLLLVGYALRPEPVRVDVAIVQRGNLRVTVDEDGRTRLRERYRISAPLAGRLLRIQLDPGDNAGVGQLLAVIEPRDPSLLDPRERAEAQARVDAADAAVRQRAAQLERAEAELRLAANEAAKYTKMFAQGAATAKERDDAVLLEQVRHQQRNAARFAGQVASFRLELAQAALLHTAGARPGTPNGPGPSTGQPQRFHISAPCDGRVLRVFQESEGVVEAGTPLLEFGDPTDIEAVVDVLSSDAVAVRPGQDVLIEHWGGERPLRGRVRVVEPSGFTKVSSLGVEEQRVNVIVDFVDPPATRQGLGDGYRVEARIVIWQATDVLRVPTSAMFRRDAAWRVFVDDDGRAATRAVHIGRRNGQWAHVLDGLTESDAVILHPSDKIDQGTHIERR